MMICRPHQFNIKYQAGENKVMPGNGTVFSYTHCWKKYCSISGNICGIPLHSPDCNSFQTPRLTEKGNPIRNALHLREEGSSGKLAGIQKHAVPQTTVFKCFNKQI
jgi:hypothetical protein